MSGYGIDQLKGHGGTLGRPTGLSCEGLTNLDASWMPLGACRGTDVDEFFPARGEFPFEALKLCAVCTVQQECLAYAVSNDIGHGIWGGLTPNARRRASRLLQRERPK